MGQLFQHLVFGGPDAVEILDLLGFVLVLQQITEVAAITTFPFLLVHGHFGIGVGYTTPGIAIGGLHLQDHVENGDRFVRLV